MKLREEPMFNIIPRHRFHGYYAPSLPIMKSECQSKYSAAIKLAKERSRLSDFENWEFI